MQNIFIFKELMLKNHNQTPSTGSAGASTPAQLAEVQSKGRAEWFDNPEASHIRPALELLTRRLSSGWPRRGHKLLELYCADGYFLEMFWQSGFDVTGQDQDAALLSKARERLRNAAEFTQAHPEQLPYDDSYFDYVVCLNGMQFTEDPQALLEEMFRVAAKGVLLAFPSAWSLHCLGAWLSNRGRAQKDKAAGMRFYSPMMVSNMINLAGGGVSNWVSALLGPACSWKLRWMRRLNYAHFPCPLGAVSMVRIDLDAPLADEGLSVGGKQSLRREPAASGLGRVSRIRNNGR